MTTLSQPRLSDNSIHNAHHPALVDRDERAESAASDGSIATAPIETAFPIEVSHYPEGLPTLGLQYRFSKRLLDLTLSLLLLPFLGALLLVISIAVALTSGLPVFYTQERVGQHGRIFRIIKFRTMQNNAEQALAEWFLHHPEIRREWVETHKIKRDPRITPLGRFLRDTSLDELPQILNVLRGDMSLIGPRPVVQAECIRYGACYPFYAAARPGVTGLWQVSGRSKCTYEERVHLDEHYVTHWSLLSDIRILLRTPSVVLRRDGAC